MYIIRPIEAQRIYLDELASAFPERFKPDSADYNRNMMSTIERVDYFVKVEIGSFPPRLAVESKPGGIVVVDGQGVYSGERKMLVYSIVSDLVAAIDVISPRDKEFIAFHPTVQ